MSVVLAVTAASLAAVQPVRAAADQQVDCQTSVTSTSMSPPRTVVGLSALRTSIYTVNLTNTCDNPGVFVNLASINQVVGRSVTMTGTDNGDGSITFRGAVVWNPADLDNEHYAGPWLSFVDAFSDNGPSLSIPGIDFQLLRSSRLSSTSPASRTVAEGGAVDVTGNLQLANWDFALYEAQGGRRVALQFKSSGSYATVRTLRTMSNGAVFAEQRATVDGCYRLVYAGSASVAAATSATTCVDVR